MGCEVLSSVGAPDIHKNRYHVSNLGYIETFWQDPDLNMDVVFQPGIDTPLSSSTFNVLQMSSMTKNQFLIDEEDKKEFFCNNSCQ